MQQFVVPQFIEVEDKIFGPITIRQFLILLGAFVLIFLGWRFGDFLIFCFNVYYRWWNCCNICFCKSKWASVSHLYVKCINEHKKAKFTCLEKNTYC